MMACANCQSPVQVGAKFCPECGTPTQKHCTNCNASLSATAKFCAECGTPDGTAVGLTAVGISRSPAALRYDHSLYQPLCPHIRVTREAPGALAVSRGSRDPDRLSRCFR